MNFPFLTLQLPDWISDFCVSWRAGFGTIQNRAAFVVALSAQQVEQATGGPFAAAVFDSGQGHLIAPGVNLVVSSSCSVAHAEMVALMVAQQIMGTHDLGAAGLPALELVSSTEPCAMCLGALPWSGVRGLVCCARGTDAEAIGMDEGEKPPGWVDALENRGIRVTRDICRAEAAAVLQGYGAGGGFLYNGRRG